MSEWVSVLRTGDPVHVAVFTSILEREGIACTVRNQGTQNLFGVGTLGAGFNVVTGPIEVRVEAEFAETALEILHEVEQAAREPEAQEPLCSEVRQDDAEIDDDGSLLKAMARGMAWCWLFGIVIFMVAGFAGSLAGLAAALAFLVFGLFGFAFQRHLHRLGYEWPTLMDANWILLRLGWKARRIPPAVDVETLPEVGAGNPDSIIVFLKSLQRHRRLARKARKSTPPRPPET